MIEASIDKTRGQTERFRISKLGAYRGFSSAFAFAKAAADSQKGALWSKGGTTPKFKSYCKSKSFAKGAPPAGTRHHGRVSGNVPSVPGFSSPGFQVPQPEVVM